MLTPEEFVSILHHNLDCACTYSDGNGDRKNWRDFGVVSGSNVWDTLDKEKNNYVSVNNYSKDIVGKRYGCRNNDNLLSYNGFFIDIDCHNEPFVAIVTDSIVDMVLELVNDSPLKGFTMCCKTGRGLAFYYLYDMPLDAKDSKNVEIHKKTYQKAFEAFEHILANVPHIKVDKSVSDSSRVCRIAGTYNTKAKRYSSCIAYNEENTYSVKEMSKLFKEKNFGVKEFNRVVNFDIDSLEDIDENFVENVSSVRKEDVKFKQYTKKRKMDCITKSNLISQCNVIAKLSQMRGMVDGQRRHNAIFIFYCSQKALNFNDVELSRENTYILNDSFATPLSHREMQLIFKSVDNHKEKTGLHDDGYFVFNRDTVSRWLQMTKKEEDITGIFDARNKRQKTEENKKNKPIKDKEEEALKKKIQKLRKQGKTYKEIQKITKACNDKISKYCKELKEKETLKIEEKHSCSEHNSICVKDNISLNSNDKENDDRINKNVVKEKNKFEKAYRYNEQKVYEDNELKEAIESLLNGKNTYLCGKGGTGKSLVSKLFIKKMEELGKNVVVAAPSGLAAFSIGGSTIHSILKMNANKVYKKCEKPSSKSLNVLKDVDCILIDECGMLRIDHFVYLTNCIKTIEKKYYKRIQLVIVGDFLQLPPVVTSKEREDLERAYGKKILYQAYEEKDIWDKHNFKVCCLKKNRRQVNDEFANMMDLTRTGNVCATSYFERFEKENSYYLEDGYIHLCAYRKDVNKVNKHIVNSHRSDKSYKEFVAILKSGNWSEKNSHMQVEAFYEGMPVMAIVNTERGFKNGSMGTITKVCGKSVYVRFLGMDKDVRVGMSTFREGSALIKQIPLVPAYAVTIHKCQSQTFEKVVVHQGMFEEGQAYVALSRVKTPEGLVICGHIKEKDIERPMLKDISTNCGLEESELNAIFG